MRRACFAFFGCLLAVACSNGTASDHTAARSSSTAQSASLSTGCRRGDFGIYRGNLHTHTSASDGDISVASAFADARKMTHVDFLAVTDHLELLYDWKGDPSGEYEDCLREAAAATRAGHFLGLCGFEYGSGYRWLRSTGHNNVYFSASLMPRLMLDFRDFYRGLVECDSCVGQFNHPARESAVQDWNDYEYHANADERLSLFELSGGADTWTEFIRALDAGWHVSPTFGQDNHEADWGATKEARTGALLEELSLESLRDALSARRTFASWDRNASIVLRTDDGCAMGSILESRSILTVTAVAEDPDEQDSTELLAIYSLGGVEVASKTCGQNLPCVVSATLNADRGVYALARAFQEDGDLLVSAPIWVVRQQPAK